MTSDRKFVLVEMSETEDTQAKLAAIGLHGSMLAFESEGVSPRLFEASVELQAALENLYSFCSSTGVYMSIPSGILEQAERALRRARPAE